ncbi:MAG: hypothetical protein FWD70_00350 [Desulfuromonadales bacterium]|nr:hypothetical protein [Desulfuromonadales bacterium]
MAICKVCGKSITEDHGSSVFKEAGEWLAEEVWEDEGELCEECLENRAKLAMMYLHEYNR